MKIHWIEAGSVYIKAEVSRFNMDAPMDTSDQDNFKADFKKYKSRLPPPDITEVIDLRACFRAIPFLIQELELETNSREVECMLGLKPISQWKAFTLDQVPGLVVIKNPFKAGYQRYWVIRCLQSYPCKPNITNLDAHMDTEKLGNIWQASLTQTGPDLKKDSILMKLRWATLGYHYDWNTKEYYEDKYTSFPEDLGLLCKCIATALGYQVFQAEAAIVNYYHMDSTLAAHTDHSEIDHQAPLISISLGQDAIFLIGGQTKATKPIALFLHSGDICIMSGAARLAYHAVPRIWPAEEDYLSTCFHWEGVEIGKRKRKLDGGKIGDISDIRSKTTWAPDYLKVHHRQQVGNLIMKSYDNVEAVTQPPLNTEGQMKQHDHEKKKNLELESNNSNETISLSNARRDNCESHDMFENSTVSSVDDEGSSEQNEKYVITNKNTSERLEEGACLKDKQLSEVESFCGGGVTNHTIFFKGGMEHDLVSDEPIVAASKANNSTLHIRTSKSDQEVWTQEKIQDIKWSSQNFAENRSLESETSYNIKMATTGDENVLGNLEEESEDKSYKQVHENIIQTLSISDWEPFMAYLQSSRININVRQVLKPGQTFGRKLTA
ncbi:hypothetical protein CHS0354_032473 [Potamilus streckersoni]|uniref:Alpha-ketoglutarate-dependent dioxygenase AlkB-like domain-containing protein n=1 Tax=Potamilus streckersoni TaxID=2493646 RepID=A0AAE0SQ30_9BIVA|nr:hypothetical protein CHS0354_032473 [Potamilus streckersoni]